MADIRRPSSFNDTTDSEMMVNQPTKQNPLAGKFISIVVILVVIILGLYLVSKFTSWNVFGLNKDDSSWQAVFLSNGQVYFGRVTSQNSQTVILKEIYYLQVNNQPALQPQDQNQAAQQPPVSLVKLGNELHGPYDEMMINRAHVLFIEDMKSTSKVVEAISNYKKEQSKK